MERAEDSNENSEFQQKVDSLKTQYNIQHHLTFSTKTPRAKINGIENVPLLNHAYNQKSYEENHNLLKFTAIYSAVAGLALFSAGLAFKFIAHSNPIFISLFTVGAVCVLVSLGTTSMFFKPDFEQKRKDSGSVMHQEPHPL